MGNQMHPWIEFLVSHQGRLADNVISDFGQPFDSVWANGTPTVMVPLLHWHLWKASGDDARAFLQGQLTNDIHLVTVDQAQFSAYCNPKGRMLATFQVFERSGALFLLTHRDLSEATIKRLRMYVLRAKATFVNSSGEFAVVGLAGPKAAEALRSILPAGAPRDSFSVISDGDTTVIRLPGPNDRFEVIAPIELMKQHWISLQGVATPVGTFAWDWFDIMSGLPTVVSATVEEFVPQMANLDLIDGVNFKKGCYPGQEIVARMHYLGSLKQRMVRAKSSSGNVPAAGTPLFSKSFGEQTAGRVVMAHRSLIPNGSDLLVVAQLTSLRANDLRIGSNDGPEIHIESLNYSVPITEGA